MSFQEPAPKEYIDLYRLYRGYVMEESGLINYRLTWIITINGFLYTSYAFTLQKLIDVVRDFGNNNYKMQTSTIFTDTMVQTNVFLITISFVGLIAGICGWMLIVTAQNASNSVTQIFDQRIMSHKSHSTDRKTFYYDIGNELVLPHIRGGGSPISVIRSHKVSRRLPLFFSLSWLLSLLLVAAVWHHNADIYGQLSTFKGFFVTKGFVPADTAKTGSQSKEDNSPKRMESDQSISPAFSKP